jgi:putative intracellular protease/amidase
MSLKNANRVNPKRPKRIAMVISSPAVSTTTGWPVGFWWSELTHPFFAFTEKGYEVECFRPRAASATATP